MTYVPTVIAGRIEKIKDEQRLVFGWASVIMTKDRTDIIDTQNDIITEEALENSVYEYMIDSQTPGLMHEFAGAQIGTLVESMVFTKEKQEALGIPKGILPIGWWIGFKVSPEIFERVKDGTLKGFSIGGRGKSEKVNV